MGVDRRGVIVYCSLFGVVHDERNFSLVWTMDLIGDIVKTMCGIHRHWRLVAFDRTTARRQQNLHVSCGLYPQAHRCPEPLLQVEGA